MMSGRLAYIRLLCAVGTVLLLSLSFPYAARTAEVGTRVIGVNADQHLTVSFSYRDVFTSEVQSKLQSGLPTRLLLQINVERQGSKRPVAYWVRSIRIVYDLWEDLYIITLEDELGKRRARTKSKKEAIEIASKVHNVEIARLKGLGAGSYRVRVSVEVNPVSKEMVENIRRWLARPRAAEGTSSGTTNYFGSFVGVFVDRRIGEADHSITFLSQWFELGAQ